MLFVLYYEKYKIQFFRIIDIQLHQHSRTLEKHSLYYKFLKYTNVGII